MPALAWRGPTGWVGLPASRHRAWPQALATGGRPVYRYHGAPPAGLASHAQALGMAWPCRLCGAASQ